MKILIFSPYYPPHTGGLESHADEFNKYMSPHVSKIKVFTPRLPFDAPEIETRFENTEIVRFPAVEIIPNYPVPKFWSIKFWQLFSQLFKEEYDITISRTRFFLTSLLALLYAKTKKTKWVHIEHGSDFVKLSSKFKVAVSVIYDYTLGKLTLSLADTLVANSKASSSFCKKLAPKKECSVIYRGVEIEKIERAIPNTELRKKHEGKTIITFIGRLIDGKGVHDLLDAVKDLKQEFILFIIGDGPRKNDLEAQVKELKLDNLVLFLGKLSHEETLGILKISDIFANPSYTEGLPTTVIEAALYEIPIVTTNVGGTPEISEKITSIEPKDVSKIKEEIEKIIKTKNSSKDKLSTIHTQVLEKFNWKNSAKKYLEIFDQNFVTKKEKVKRKWKL